MRIAIHQREGSFSESWITYCKERSIDYIIVNCYNNDILLTLKEENITHLLWHFHHSSSTDLRVAPYVLNSAEIMGIRTFPDFKTRWHFDDKVAQKYLFEAIEAPLVPSFVFYTQRESIRSLDTCEFPLVAKLRRGAGSTNVKLLMTRNEALNYINAMFGEGLAVTGGVLSNLDQKLRVSRAIKNPFVLLKKVIRYTAKSKTEQKISSPEKGYFYYQKFMPNNVHDTRVIIIGKKGVAFKRFTKKGDFRASGSGLSTFEGVDPQLVKIAFKITKELNLQSAAYDFVYDVNGIPKIIEVCYAFGTTLSTKADGYWFEDGTYHAGKFDPQTWIIDNMLHEKIKV